MKEIVETATCDRCGYQSTSGNGWLSVREGYDQPTTDLCPTCYADFKAWVKE